MLGIFTRLEKIPDLLTIRCRFVFRIYLTCHSR